MKKKILKILLLFLLIIVLALGLIIGYNIYINSKEKNDVIEEIKGYNYKLDADSPSKYESLFHNLADVLDSDTIDEEEYAKLVAQMFVFDFYNLKDKRSKNDIGGVNFVYEEERANFILKASDTMYKYIEQNLYNERTQELPEVEDITVGEIKNSSYKYNNETDSNAYIITIDIDYKEDRGYPTRVNITLIHDEQKVEVPIEKEAKKFIWWPFNQQEEEIKYEKKTIKKLCVVAVKNA